MDKKLLILGCAERKRGSDVLLPALHRYDGPAYRVVRKFLRKYQWPEDVSIAVLSAEYGLFGILKGIRNYDKRMDLATAQATAAECLLTLGKWSSGHQSVHVSLGRDYLPAVQPGLERLGFHSEVFGGGIGQKLNQVKTFLTRAAPPRRITPVVEGGAGRYRYFLPDWDDLLDPGFDFDADAFSGASPSERSDKHCCVLMRPNRMCDGILVSLAQQGSKKGPLRRPEGTEDGALSPPPMRRHFGLTDDQYLFGDCGAFSYVGEQVPSITVEQAVALYESYAFDFGASVDHIPVATFRKGGERIELSSAERQQRVDITRENAQLFIDCATRRKVSFVPVGIIQALTPDQYARFAREYYEFGYRHLAIGGLVPQRDSEVEQTVRAVMQAVGEMPDRPWVHLFGIYRPRLQSLFKQLKVDSFDSASYFRKAWLRSDQNYLGSNGQWYAALRVPMTRDPRTRKRLRMMDMNIEDLAVQERQVLRLLSQYEKEEAQLDDVLEVLLEYDGRLARSSETKSMRSKYRRTLADRPWETCECTFCSAIGIHMLIFRGTNRNKRRGAHNTWMLYGSVTETSQCD